jgi:hypothetical protein
MAIENYIASFGQNTGAGLVQGLQAGMDERYRNAMMTENKRRYDQEAAAAQQNAILERQKAQEQAERELLKSGTEALLSAPEDQRPSIYRGMMQRAKQLGFDTTDDPQDYTPDILPMLMGATGVKMPEAPKMQYKVSGGQLIATDPSTGMASASPIPGYTAPPDPFAELKGMQMQSNIATQEQTRALREAEQARKAEADRLAAEKAQAEVDKLAQGRQQAQDMAMSMATKARELLADKEALDNYSGFEGMQPTVMPSQRSWEGKLAQLKNSLTLENLKIMAGTGALSNADIMMLERAGNSLVEGGSREENEKELNRILAKFEAAAGGQKQSPQQSGQSAQQQYQAPPGIDPADWAEFTPEEKAAFMGAGQ